MNIDKYISQITPDLRARKILKNAALVDDSQSSRCVLKAFLGPEITHLTKLRAPRLIPAAQAFVRAPEPRNIYRGIQLYIWLNEKVPEGHDRETLILLGMMSYIEQEKKADVAREMVDFMTVIL